MNTDGVLRILREAGVNPNACLVKPRVPVEGALCLVFGDGTWTVFFNERGTFTIRESFDSEDQACRFFLKKALSDPTSRTNFRQTDLVEQRRRAEADLRKYGL